MISAIKICNFQSHKRTILELHPGVNCIVGSSDVGKTAIIRALRWLVWNRPQGDAFRSTWGGSTAVTVELDDATIKREKDKENVYHLEKGDEANVKFSAIGSDVPEEVSAALNVGETNLQQQFDRPFLLDESPGAVSQFFNMIARLDVIDNALKNVQSWIRTLLSETDRHAQNSNKLKEELKDFEGLDEVDGSVTEVEHECQERNTVSNSLKKLTEVVHAVETADLEIDRLSKLTEHSKLVDYTLDQIDYRNIDRDKLNSLRNTVSEINAVNMAIDRMPPIVELESSINSVVEMVDDKAKLLQRMSSITSHVRNIRQITADITLIETQIEKDSTQFKKDFPNVCPLCGGSIDISMRTKLL